MGHIYYGYVKWPGGSKTFPTSRCQLFCHNCLFCFGKLQLHMPTPKNVDKSILTNICAHTHYSVSFSWTYWFYLLGHYYTLASFTHLPICMTARKQITYPDDPYLKVLEPFESSSACKLYMSYPDSGKGFIAEPGGFLLRTKVVSEYLPWKTCLLPEHLGWLSSSQDTTWQT